MPIRRAGVAWTGILVFRDWRDHPTSISKKKEGQGEQVLGAWGSVSFSGVVGKRLIRQPCQKRQREGGSGKETPANPP